MFRSLLRRLARDQKIQPIRRARPLRVEGLEDRSTPATFAVTTLADAGPGSLRAAIDAANAAPDADTIVFDPAVRGGRVNLTSYTNLPASTAEVPQPAGPSAFIVTTPVTIRGTGETITRLFPSVHAFRLFQVTATGSLTLQNLTLSNGTARGGYGGAGGGGGAGLGGAIYNQGTLTVTGSTLTGNKAIGGGAPTREARLGADWARMHSVARPGAGRTAVSVAGTVGLAAVGPPAAPAGSAAVGAPAAPAGSAPGAGSAVGPAASVAATESTTAVTGPAWAEPSSTRGALSRLRTRPSRRTRQVLYRGSSSCRVRGVRSAVGCSTSTGPSP